MAGRSGNKGKRYHDQIVELSVRDGCQGPRGLLLREPAEPALLLPLQTYARGLGRETHSSCATLSKCHRMASGRLMLAAFSSRPVRSDGFDRRSAR